MNKDKIISNLKLLAIYILTGVFCGIIGTLFSKGVYLVTNIRNSNPWFLYLLPLAGVVSVAIYKMLKVTDMGTNQVLKSANGEQALSSKLVPAVFFASVLSHLCGASVGREGAALQLGGGTATFFSNRFKLTESQRKIMIYCGMSGVFSSVFGTPFTAAVFALEVVFVGKIFYPAIASVFISSFTSYFTSILLGAHPEQLVLAEIPKINFYVIVKLVAMSLLTIIVSIVFCLALKYFERLFKKFIANDFLRVVVGAVIIILLTIVVGTYDYNGTGMHVIERVFDKNEFVPYAFVLKILFTAICVGVGYKGGEIVPTLFIGATFGALVGSAFGLPIPFAAAFCMICLFCCVTNCPIASILLAVELFSSKGVLYIVIGVVITYFLSGKTGLYSEQKTKGFKSLF